MTAEMKKRKKERKKERKKKRKASQVNNTKLPFVLAGIVGLAGIGGTR